MSAAVISIQPSHPTYLDDEITALALQLEEINYHGETRKGKYPAESPPDLAVAYVDYQAEITAHLAFLRDVKLAHSVAHAVDADAEAIAEFAQEESRAQEDRRIAVQISTDNPELEAPPPDTEEGRNEFIDDEIIRRFVTHFASEEAHFDEEENGAGPSVPYAQRQADAFGRLSREQFECCSCRDSFRWASITRLSCGDDYCNRCLKRIILRAVSDNDLACLPPRCHGNPIPPALIEAHLSEEELDDFRNAEIEKMTRDKTFCSNSECGRFIASSHIRAGEAVCPRCNALTCTLCKNPFHGGDCPADPQLQVTLELGVEQHWQRCFSCRALVEIDTGCNHMRRVEALVLCRCGAEFCYLCGVEWHRCECAFWTEVNLVRRAEERVDRVAPLNILPAERQRRIQEMQDNMHANQGEHEDCNHHGRKKFQQIYGGRGGSFLCEICYTRHRKFILECKRCQLQVCMDCRRTRI
ncbi:uncharacterized protein BDR25DRAFT_364571 [Lindgomyces ingoldianus]|uniref:Uncharacterized protein n=1 Tax=Lindgomyces ingoldianus TaxID=673940 RepID=A0ACB6REX9_9PLEO|nr:uncharacterized protein BDR25DRAFT_364571 [Lindgomyces ingoldianus]KAF2477677.1 hypothetical protein BDR25DRAFT_364571 [Lindgomyces ingoldianus]